MELLMDFLTAIIIGIAKAIGDGIFRIMRMVFRGIACLFRLARKGMASWFGADRKGHGAVHEDRLNFRERDP